MDCRACYSINWTSQEALRQKSCCGNALLIDARRLMHPPPTSTLRHSRMKKRSHSFQWTTRQIFLIVSCKANHLEWFPSAFWRLFHGQLYSFFIQSWPHTPQSLWTVALYSSSRTIPSIENNQPILILTKTILHFGQRHMDVNNNPGDAENHPCRSLFRSSLHDPSMSISGIATCGSDRLERQPHFHDNGCWSCKHFLSRPNSLRFWFQLWICSLPKCFVKHGLAENVWLFVQRKTTIQLTIRVYRSFQNIKPLIFVIFGKRHKCQRKKSLFPNNLTVQWLYILERPIFHVSLKDHPFQACAQNMRVSDSPVDRVFSRHTVCVTNIPF